MELCLDNPREGFSDLFATHPSVDSRVQALVKFAGGHDPGRLAPPPEMPDDQSAARPIASGPWSDGQETAAGGRQAASGAPDGPWGAKAGPWGRRR
jgi:heat shock protein HtpX